MRRSPELHALAALRLELNLTQKELARRIGMSPKTIQAVELKKLELSDKMAMRVHDETGVDIGWLKNGKPSVPVDSMGNALTLEKYEKKRAADWSNSDPHFQAHVTGIYSGVSVLALLGLYVKMNNERSAHLQYKVNEMILDLYKEFWPGIRLNDDPSWPHLLQLVRESVKDWKTMDPRTIAELVGTNVTLEKPAGKKGIIAGMFDGLAPIFGPTRKMGAPMLPTELGKKPPGKKVKPPSASQ